MTVKPLRHVERWIRGLAYDALSRRDGLYGWKSSRTAFLCNLKKDRETLAKETVHKLRAIVVHAFETTAYYQERWRAIGFRPSSSFVPQDLQSLPFLTKETIRNEKAALVSKSYQSTTLDLSHTGGTTGTQTSFYLNHDCTVARVGRRWAMHELCGYRPGMRRALVWGVHADLLDASVRGSIKRRLRKYASSDETLCCTIMSERSMLEYHARLLRFRPVVLYGYPSALAHLGRFMEDRRLEPIRVGTIITTAERLGSATRRQLSRLFGAEVFNLYATREYGCIGFECRKHDGFHIDTGSVFVEIVEDGHVLEAGQSGEIVITDFLNYGMPFIRSRTGDLGVLSAEPCACGSPLPLLKGLDGRSTEVAYRPDGSVVPGLMLTDICKELPSIRYLQFVQESVDQLDVLLVVTGEFSDAMRAEVLREVRQIMGHEIAVRIRLVDDIERNPRSGKIQEVICKVDRRRAPEPLSAKA